MPSNSSEDENEALNEILYFLKIIGKNLKEVILYKSTILNKGS